MSEKLQISLAAARVNAGFTLEEVAKKLHKTKQTIVNWEKGRSKMDVNTFNELCILYNVPSEYIVLPFHSTLSGMKERKKEWKK